MNAQNRIRTNLTRIMDTGEANAAAIWKGYDVGTGMTGWHYVKFGETAVFLGSNLTEALATIDEIAGEREGVSAQERSAAAAALGSIRSERKAATSRENGKLGGRPRKITLDDALASLPENAQEGDHKTVPMVVIGATCGTVDFGFYDGRWQRWQGRATSERGIDYNAYA